MFIVLEMLEASHSFRSAMFTAGVKTQRATGFQDE